jgi:hypothetical protein
MPIAEIAERSSPIALHHRFMSTQDLPSNADEEEDLPSLLLQRIWQGKLPAKISLAANESKSFTNSPPLYVPPPSPLSAERANGCRSNSRGYYTFPVSLRLASTSSRKS